MAVEQLGGGVMQIPPNAQRAEVTLSSSALWHYITDDELERIGDVSDTLPMQIFLASAGALAGAVMPAVISVTHIDNPAHPFGKIDLLTVLVAAMAFSLAVLSGLLWWQKAKRRTPLIEQIRSRPRLAVAHENAT